MGGTSVSATARQAQDQPGLAERLGIKPGQVVQEIGYDDDCDEALREAIASLQDVEQFTLGRPPAQVPNAPGSENHVTV